MWSLLRRGEKNDTITIKSDLRLGQPGSVWSHEPNDPIISDRIRSFSLYFKFKSNSNTHKAIIVKSKAKNVQFNWTIFAKVYSSSQFKLDILNLIFNEVLTCPFYLPFYLLKTRRWIGVSKSKWNITQRLSMSSKIFQSFVLGSIDLSLSLNCWFCSTNVELFSFTFLKSYLCYRFLIQ
jgi:hypothetical protein